MMTAQFLNSTRKQLVIAFVLAVFTIIYNIAEGFLATRFGVEEESFTLFGFGADSFIEVISGTGIATMILRIKKKPESGRGRFEKQALQITGFAFYLLLLVLIASAWYSFYQNHQPVASKWGLIISLVSILVMWWTIIWKLKIGKALNSPAIIADAECARVCIYMSLILLFSSLCYSLFKIPYVDAIGALFLAYFSYKEGKECFEKAKNDSICSCHSH